LKLQLLCETVAMSSSPSLDPLRSSLWRLFLTAHARLLDRMEQPLAQADLPPMEWYDVLFTLKEAPDNRLRLSELAKKILLSRSNLTRLIDRLERAGLLRREACPSDRRGTFAVLTEAGLTMQQQMWTVYSQSIDTYFAAQIDETEAQMLQQLLQRLIRAADMTKP
jgi:DNA-binding MarR family transcriptional regulator